jgi:hypothetical protein
VAKGLPRHWGEESGEAQEKLATTPQLRMTNEISFFYIAGPSTDMMLWDEEELPPGPVPRPKRHIVAVPRGSKSCYEGRWMLEFPGILMDRLG